MLRLLVSPLRLLLLAGGLAAAASAQIWPEDWHGSTRTKAEPVTPEDRLLYFEYGGDSAERAVYKGPVGSFSATAWRLQDATAALAWYQATRPESCVADRSTKLLCTTPGAEYLAFDNYVLKFEGWRPLAAELAELKQKLPRLRSGGGLPVLASYLPEKGLVRNSERYLLGLRSLEKYLPGFPAAIAGFEDGAEAQMGTYSLAGAEKPVVIFHFVTPQLAMERAKALDKLQGYTYHRSGPLVAIAPGSDAAAAAPLLKLVDYRANAIWDTPGKLPPMPNVGGMLVAIFELTGVLLLACLGGGVLFAGLWILLRRRHLRADGSEDTMTVLSLSDR